ncbi:MAG: hypothetical protein ACRYG7_31605 [Janthinobacterium lividum]
MASDNNLDDLFRQQLGQHATPPGEDLQRRLAELAEAERLDQLFRTGLGSHASQPRRALWERLEDEHLRPPARRRRGAVAWWQLSAAAMLLLALLGGGLWRGGYLGPAGGLASRPAGKGAGGARVSLGPAAPDVASGTQMASSPLAQAAPEQAMEQTTSSSERKNQKSFSRQATAAAASSSSTPIATTTRPRRTATAPQAAGSFRKKPRPLDAAAGQLATTGRRNSPASQLPTALAEVPAPAARPSLPVVAMTSATEVVEVEVRRGAAPASPVPAPVVALAEPTHRRRLRLGGLLRQADHLVHGESVSLAEATGLPESLTVQARLGGRLVRKTIQL